MYFFFLFSLIFVNEIFTYETDTDITYHLVGRELFRGGTISIKHVNSYILNNNNAIEI